MKKLFYGLIIIAIICVSVWAIPNFKKENPDPGYLINELQKSSKLTTATLTFDGYYEYEDDGVLFVNKGNFLMIYNATAEAGINLKDVKITENKITGNFIVKVPHATIQRVDLNNDKPIKYYNESFALFNFDSKEDAIKAEALAEEKAEEYLSTTGILEYADQYAFELIESLLKKIEDDCTYELSFI